MVNHAQAQQLGTLNPIPAPRLSPPIFDIPTLLGLTQIGDTFQFHAVGDTGGADTKTIEAVGDAMALDGGPQFYLHLGDVMYGANKGQEYLDRFYRPYNGYPHPIIAIPGNHDGETKSVTDPTSLAAFWDNFCAASPGEPVDVAQTGMTRQTMNLPSVYWMGRAPLVDIIGLYSNTGENGGTLVDGHDDQSQIEFLTQALQIIAAERASGTRKALVIATHHPPFSSSGHSDSLLMLGQIDAVCASAGIYPDLFLGGHAHNYQRYTREFTFNGQALSRSYIVAGTGGYPSQAVRMPIGTVSTVGGDTVTYNQAIKAYGYLIVSVTASAIQVTMKTVSAESVVAEFDTVTINL